MRRDLRLVGVSSLVGLLVGGAVGAALVTKMTPSVAGHDFIVDLMKDGWAAREIYRGQGRQHADRLRDGFPERVILVDQLLREAPPERVPKDPFSDRDFRNTAFRVVKEAYDASGSEIPVEIRPILLSVPPRPIHEEPTRVR